jgi:hypothetical protein
MPSDKRSDTLAFATSLLHADDEHASLSAAVAPNISQVSLSE